MKGSFKFFLLLLLLAVLNLIIFAQVFPSFLFADDFMQIYAQRSTDVVGFFSAVYTSSISYLFRPVHYFMLGIYCQLIKFGIFYCYLLLFFAHLLAAISVFFFLKKIKNSFSFAAIGSLLFLVYCGNWEAVGWAAVIYYPIFVALFLASIIQFSEKRIILSTVLFLFALLTHEAGILFVPIVAAYILFIQGRNIKKEDILDLLPAAVISAVFGLFYVIRPIVLPGTVSPLQYHFGLHFIWNELNYIATLIIPVITSYRGNQIIPGAVLTLIGRLKFLIALFAPFLFVWVFWKGSGKVKFFSIWILLTLLPFSFFVSPPVSRYVYIASVGFVSIIALMIDACLEKKGLRAFGAIVFLVLLVFNLAAMCVYQRLFYNKKEVRRNEIKYVLSKAPVLDPGASMCFVDIPIREDEIKGMIYLAYNSHGIVVRTVNADNIPYKRAYDPRIKYGCKYLFVYDPAKQMLQLLN
jgi:hypothetical protein